MNRFMDSVSKSFKADSATEATYNQAAGGLLAARHILIGYKNPGVPATAGREGFPAQEGAEIRAQVTPANFADMVKKYSTDPTAGRTGQPRRLPEGHDGRAVLERHRGAQAG